MVERLSYVITGFVGAAKIEVVKEEEKKLRNIVIGIISGVIVIIIEVP